MAIYNSALDIIGKTPVVKLESFDHNIYVKLEYLNPSGSIKDIPAKRCIEDAYKSGELKKGQTVIDATSGNMGISLSMVCNILGHDFIAVMSEGNSPERFKIMKAMGAQIILVPQVSGVPGKVTGEDLNAVKETAVRVSEENKYFFVNQFNNKSNYESHRDVTAKIMYDELGGEIDIFACAVGTGGTFIGCAKYFKSINPSIKCVPVEPESISVLAGCKVKEAKHIIQATSYGFIPLFYDSSDVDEFVSVSDDEVIECRKKLIENEGLYVGFSSAANVCGCMKLGKKYPEARIATVIPDSGARYLI